MSLRDFFEEYLGLQGERLNAIAEEPLNVLKEAILQAIPDAEVRGPERIPTGFKMEVSKCLDNGRCIQEFVCVSKRTLNDPELFANFLSIEISRLSESILEKEREPLWGFQPPPFVEDLDHDRITDDSSAETIRNYFTSLMANVELPEIRSEDPQLHTHVSVFDNSDLSASDRVVVSLGCGELHGFAMHGGTVEIARTPENLELIESLLCQSEDPQLHAHVSVDCASEGARDSLQHWYNLTRLANYRFEASANQAIAETHKLQEQCRGCQNRNRDFDGPVAPEHLRDLKCAINPVFAMDGVGECADYEADDLSNSQRKICKYCKRWVRTDEEICSKHGGGARPLCDAPLDPEYRRLLFASLINRLQSIPGVQTVDIEAQMGVTWCYEILVYIKNQGLRRFGVTKTSLRSSMFAEIVEEIIARVMEGDRS